MANIAAIREQLYELSQVAKDMAEDPKLEEITTDDAWFISTVTTTMLSIAKKEQS